MAEHLDQPRADTSDSPMNWMGRPLSPDVRGYGYRHALDMGLDPVDAFHVTEGVANALERDQPYEAQKAGIQFLDLMGTYRLQAALLAAASEEHKCKENENG